MTEERKREGWTTVASRYHGSSGPRQVVYRNNEAAETYMFDVEFPGNPPSWQTEMRGSVDKAKTAADQLVTQSDHRCTDECGLWTAPESA